MADDEKVDPTEFIQKKDIWMHILPFVGAGHFIYVAGINHQLKELYKESIEANDNSYVATRPAASSDTFYSAAFSSVSCANYWNGSNKRDSLCLEDDRVCTMVARHGNLEVLKWARKQGFEWGEDTCFEAAENGHLELLKYAHEKGCPWDYHTCWAAAESGHLEVLKYAHEKGCPWDWSVCAEAAENGYLEKC